MLFFDNSKHNIILAKIKTYLIPEYSICSSAKIFSISSSLSSFFFFFLDFFPPFTSSTLGLELCSVSEFPESSCCAAAFPFFPPLLLVGLLGGSSSSDASESLGFLLGLDLPLLLGCGVSSSLSSSELPPAASSSSPANNSSNPARWGAAFCWK